MMNKKKGQGALEYLLLIGGAVLIAVIVIALLVGMGGQSRGTAQDQATKASKVLDQPQPATVVSVAPGVIGNCTTLTTGDYNGTMSFNWQKLSEGGTYTMKVYDYSNNAKNVYIQSGGALNTNILDNNGAAVTAKILLNGAAPTSNKCQDTYWIEITTTKNGQSVTSTRMKYNWQ